jgi:hypothetical protein
MSKQRPPTPSNFEQEENATDAVIHAIEHKLGEDAPLKQIAVVLGKAMGRIAVCSPLTEPACGDPVNVTLGFLARDFEDAMNDAYDYALGEPDYLEPRPAVPAKTGGGSVVKLHLIPPVKPGR